MGLFGDRGSLLPVRPMFSLCANKKNPIITVYFQLDFRFGMYVLVVNMETHGREDRAVKRSEHIKVWDPLVRISHWCVQSVDIASGRHQLA